MKREYDGGFSVIEALVAVAVLAIAMTSILVLQAQTTRSATREAQVRAALTDQRNALAVLHMINPMQQPDGRSSISERRYMTWRARLLSRVTSTLPRAGAETAFDAALYRLTVEIRDSRNVLETSFVVDQLGWRPHTATQQ